jgi:hypothetical protein
MNPRAFESRHWTLALGICLVAASPGIWAAFGWGWALVSAALGIAGVVAAVLGAMADYALSYLDETDKDTAA